MFNKTRVLCLLIVAGLCALAVYNQATSNYAILFDGADVTKTVNRAPLQPHKARIARIVFPADGYRDSISVSYRADAKALALGGSEEIEQTCTSAAAEQHCNFNFSAAGSAANEILLDFGEPANLKDFQITVLKEKAVTGLGGRMLSEALLALLILIPILWLLHDRKVHSQWLILTVSILLLFRIQPYFTCILLPFLCISYYLGTTDGPLQKKLARPLYILLTGVIFLLLAKYCYAALFDIFANPGAFRIFLPLGISYFMIRLIDTQLKWYRGEFKDVSLREYLVFILFLPTIPAGPIETIDNFIGRRLTHIGKQDILYGGSRILIGLFQKLFIVDYLITPHIFGANGMFFSVPTSQDTTSVVPMLILSLMFVYLDFSAYSNIAIGLGRLMGYKISENFNWPLLASNPREYWKRWHMTLSNWCMRNIYFPLLIKTRQILLPSFMVMFVVGMWHSISLSWGLWAMHHSAGIYLAGKFQKLGLLSKPSDHFYRKMAYVPGVLFTIFYISAGHAFAQYEDTGTAIRLYVAFWAQLPNYLWQQVIALAT